MFFRKTNPGDVTDRATRQTICRNAAAIKYGTKQVTFTKFYPRIVYPFVAFSEGTHKVNLLHCGMHEHRMILGKGFETLDVMEYTCFSDESHCQLGTPIVGVLKGL